MDAELERLGVEVGFVGKSIGERELSREEQRAYLIVAGQLTQMVMSELITRQSYQDATPAQQANILESAKTNAKSAARGLLSAVMESDDYRNGSEQEQQKILDRLLERWSLRMESRR